MNFKPCVNVTRLVGNTFYRNYLIREVKVTRSNPDTSFDCRLKKFIMFL